MAIAQPDPSGIDFVAIGVPANRGWDRGEDIIGRVQGRGAVGYEYRIGKTEVTTAQWLEFVNTFSARSDQPAASLLPLTWGGVPDPEYVGPGERYMLSGGPSAGMRFVGGLTWRQGAMFCNWLCNDKSASLSAIADGAYDTSTFGYNGLLFTDQAAHHPNARYWIPTLDEWMKGAYYAPQQDYWFLYPNSSDTPLVPGQPGVGQANFGPGDFNAHAQIPLGSYPQTMSPWGLLDLSGATAEWTESIVSLPVAGENYRIIKGTYYADGDSSGAADSGRGYGGLRPEFIDSIYGLRIASAIPSPGCTSIAVLVSLWRLRRRRPCSNTRVRCPRSSWPA